MNDENRRPSRSGFLKALLVTTDTQQATVAGGVQFLTSSLFFLAGDSPAPANRERKPKKTTDDGHGDGARARASSDGPLALDVFLLLDARQPAVYPLAAAGSAGTPGLPMIRGKKREVTVRTCNTPRMTCHLGLQRTPRRKHWEMRWVCTR